MSDNQELTWQEKRYAVLTKYRNAILGEGDDGSGNLYWLYADEDGDYPGLPPSLFLAKGVTEPETWSSAYAAHCAPPESPVYAKTAAPDAEPTEEFPKNVMDACRKVGPRNYGCCLPKGHDGDHRAWGTIKPLHNFDRWPNTERPLPDAATNAKCDLCGRVTSGKLAGMECNAHVSFSEGLNCKGALRLQAVAVPPAQEDEAVTTQAFSIDLPPCPNCAENMRYVQHLLHRLNVEDATHAYYRGRMDAFDGVEAELGKRFADMLRDVVLPSLGRFVPKEIVPDYVPQARASLAPVAQEEK